MESIFGDILCLGCKNILVHVTGGWLHTTPHPTQFSCRLLRSYSYWGWIFKIRDAYLFVVQLWFFTTQASITFATSIPYLCSLTWLLGVEVACYSFSSQAIFKLLLGFAFYRSCVWCTKLVLAFWHVRIFLHVYVQVRVRKLSQVSPCSIWSR